MKYALLLTALEVKRVTPAGPTAVRCQDTLAKSKGRSSWHVIGNYDRL